MIQRSCASYFRDSSAQPAAASGANMQARTAGRSLLRKSDASRMHVVCMAHPRRVAKVASQIQREISEMFIYDKVVQAAICPERRVGLDDQLSAVASITEVYVSGDLQVAKVYVSVYSDEAGKQQAMNNLKRVAPYVRSRIGAAMGLRLTPEVRFIQDNTADELEQLQEAIGREDFERYAAEAEAETTGAPVASSSSSRSVPAGSSSNGNRAEAAAGFAPEDMDDDAGFFDMGGSNDLAAGGDSSSSPSSSGAVRSQVEWSRHDPNTFFAVDEDELLEADSTWYKRRGPFDDLFADTGDEVAQERRPRGGRGRGRGKGAGRRPAQQQQQQ